MFKKAQNYFLSGFAAHSAEVRKKMQYMFFACVFTFSIFGIIIYAHYLQQQVIFVFAGDLVLLLAVIHTLVCLRKARPVATVNSMFLVLLTLFIYHVCGDFFYQGVRHVEFIYQTIIEHVFALLFISVVALNIRQLVYFTLLSIITILAHTYVIIIRFYSGELAYVFGYVGVGLIVVFTTGFITILYFNLHRELLGEVEALHADLEKKVTQRTKQLKGTNETLARTRDALWGEMQLAKKIQTMLLPREPSMPGYEISAFMESSDEIGGDYYDVINASGRDWLVIGDVSGQGVTAGLVTMMVQTSIHSVLQKNSHMSPSDLLEAINPVISSNIEMLGEDRHMAITAFACHANGDFNFSGRHQDIMIYRNGSETVDCVKTRGMRIGKTDETGDTHGVDKINMNTNDVMLLFTDGITGATYNGRAETGTDTGQDMFSDTKLLRVFETLGSQPTDDIKGGILNALAGYTINDDVTMVIIKRIN